jgi:hypothetical protein
MNKSGWIPGVAVLLAAQIGSIAVGCGNTPPAGGTDGSGGNSGGSGGSTGGAGGEACPSEVNAGGTCGRCEIPVADYCAEHECEFSQESASCFGRPFRTVASTACDYYRLAQMDGFAVPEPLSVDIWNIASGELVYHFSRSKDAEGCEPDVIVGQEPDCVGNSVVCDTGYSCSTPPHAECHGPCYQGCLAGFSTCGEAEAACVAAQGGEGGLGGGAP